jgi:hypothetical protein
MRSVIVVFLTSSSTESWKAYFLVSLLSHFGACINMCDWLILGGTDIHHLHSSNGMLMGSEHCGRTVVCRCILLEDASREWTPQDWGVLCKIGCRRNHSSRWVKRTMYSFHWYEIENILVSCFLCNICFQLIAWFKHIIAGKLISKVAGFAELFKPLQNSCLSLIVDYCPLFSFSTLTSICGICRWSFSSGTHSRHKEKGWSIFGLFFT